eukprot:SAG11_NODE_15924_length_562_cov_1.434125_1_plen_38_part_10
MFAYQTTCVAHLQHKLAALRFPGATLATDKDCLVIAVA